MHAKDEIKILGDYVRRRLEVKNIPVSPYIFLENILCLVLAAKISFHLPTSEVPITLQSLAVALIGIIYGAKTGALGIAAYLLMGAVGMPVFSGSQAGSAYLLSTTGGFLAGFLPSVIMAGIFAHYEWDRDFKKSLVALFASQIMIVAFGVLWMQEGLKVHVNTLQLILPLLPGLVIKTLLGALFLKMCWSAIEHFNTHQERFKDF